MFEADAAMLESESKTADMVAQAGKTEDDEGETGSLGTSFDGASGSLWWPVGINGRRSVPLLGAGVRPIESQMML